MQKRTAFIIGGVVLVAIVLIAVFTRADPLQLEVVAVDRGPVAESYTNTAWA